MEDTAEEGDNNAENSTVKKADIDDFFRDHLEMSKVVHNDSKQEIPHGKS